MVGPDEILKFWLDEQGPKDWFVQNDDLDDAIRKRFGRAWQEAVEGRFALWLTYPNGVLAYIILTDQFPRNMFRNSQRAFQTDRAALAAAKSAIARGWDQRVDAPARLLFYMPLQHSENLSDQDRSVRLIHERMDDEQFLLHARVHRDVIRQFGRFPDRNAALGRKSTAVEQAFLDAGGYGATVRKMQEAEAA